MDRKIYFPNVHNARVLFSPTTEESVGYLISTMDPKTEKWSVAFSATPKSGRLIECVRIGTFCTVQGGVGMEYLDYQSCRVSPSVRVVNWMQDHIIHIDRDTTHFKFIIFPKCAHLYLSHGVILGDYLLAEVRHDGLADLGIKV